MPVKSKHSIAYMVVNGKRMYVAHSPDDDLGDYHTTFTDNYQLADWEIHPSEQEFLLKKYPEMVFENV